MLATKTKAPSKKKAEATVEAPPAPQPPKRCGTIRDSVGKYMGKYVYLQKGVDDDLYAAFCRSWIETAESDSRFFITVDLETTGLRWMEGRILLVAISWNGHDSVVFRPSDFDMEMFRDVLNRVPLNNQNIKFDLKWIYWHYKADPYVYFDPMVASQMGWAGKFPERSYGLDNLCKQLLRGLKLDKEVRGDFHKLDWSDGREFEDQHIEYAARDAVSTHLLVKPIRNRLANMGLLKLWEEVERPLIEILAKAEYKGVMIDVERLEELYAQKQAELVEMQEDLQETLALLPGFKLPNTCTKGIYNPGSPKQVVDVMGALGIHLKNTEEATLDEARTRFQHPVLDKTIKFRKLKSEISKYLESWLKKYINPVTKCIHTNFKSYGTTTGRLACSEPNMQNITGDYRSMIVARPGCIIFSRDYSQYEFRACAAITKEPKIIGPFQDRANLMPRIKALATAHGEVDPDAFVKKVNLGRKKDYKPKDQKDQEKWEKAAKVATALSDSENELVDLFTGTDIHMNNIANMLEKEVLDVTPVERQIGKTLGYAVLYKAGPSTIYGQLTGDGVHTLGDGTTLTMEICEKFQKKFTDTNTCIKEFIRQCDRSVVVPKENGECYVETILGRKRFVTLPPAWRSDFKKEKAKAEREFCNFPFQGNNADATKTAIVRTFQEYVAKWGDPIFGGGECPNIILNVHDEVVVEAKEEIWKEADAILEKHMIQAGNEALNHQVPVEVSMSFGKVWQK